MKKIKLFSIQKFFISLIATIILLAGFISPVQVAFAACPPTPGDPHTKEVLGPSGTYECVLPDANGGANGTLTNISSVIIRITNILNLIIPFLVGLAVFLIIYGIFGYISNAADEEKRKEARDFIIWGVVGVFIMVSVWGLINILVNSFATNNSNAIVKNTYNTGVVPELGTSPTLITFIDRVNAIGPYLIGFLISIAVFIILLGIVNYIRQGANEEKRAEGRSFIIWGVISVFLMLSIWGLVNILIESFKFNNQVPSLQTIFNNLQVK